MVNTRRMESNGSAPDISPRDHTRDSTLNSTALESSIASDSNTEENTEEPQENDTSWSSGKSSTHHHKKKSKTLPPRVRELRNRFVCNELKYPKLRSSRKHSIDERTSLSVYSSHKMDDDSFNDNDSDDVFPRRAYRLRPSQHTRSLIASMQRRTALSLRPISLKSYADPHSPLTYNSDDSEVGLRRSTRKRKVQFENMSWLNDDHQITKVGYPNLNVGYSEEDSRDVQGITQHISTRSIYRTRQSHPPIEINGINTRREIKKNPKYLFDFETADIHSKRRKSRNDNCTEENENGEKAKTRRDSNEKQEKDSEKRINGKLKSDETTAKEENSQTEEDGKHDTLEDKDADLNKSEDTNGVENNKEEDESNSSENYEMRNVPSRQRRGRIIDEKYSPKRTRSRKVSESTTSSEVGKVYSLRDRPPKQTAKPIRSRMQPHELDVLRPRRHRVRRRKMSSSSSASSTDSDDLVRKPSKYRSNNAKAPHSKTEQQLLKSGSSKIMPIGPETLDKKVRFSSVGGLDGHIRCLKEMILLPMMYPEVFRQFQIQPPRGVLFHGPPGTGKTLIARALANECCFGTRKVSFFMRKGADLLSKWVGESEKQLRLLFEQASEMKPSIIFFDELDGLAPIRSSRQDQIHASIVSTLLALMDGLDSRGEVIIIGATNRIDAIDPALRRPGRFDRELFFPLPARREREEILNVHVSQWGSPPSSELITYLADNAAGYCGSDLRALCSEAVIQSLRRIYPQVYTSEHRLLVDPEKVKVEKVDFLRAKSLLVPASHRISQGVGRKLLPILEPILNESLKQIIAIIERCFPHGVDPALAKVKLSACIKPAQFLITGNGSEHGQTVHLAPAILHQMEHIHGHVLDLSTLYKDAGRSPEEACLQVFQEARRNVPSVIYVPSIDQFWSLVNDTIKTIFLSHLSQLDPNIPILLLATANNVYKNLPAQLQNIFSPYRKEVFHLQTPNNEHRKLFFKNLIIDGSLKASKPARQKAATPPPLPRAATPPMTPVTEDQARKVYELEECTLRELRIFLRDMCKKLANNKLFYMFTKPVDTEEVPDYTAIIKQPMDLETMMTKVDFHRYECAKDFLADIELIVQNALEYNPAKTSADKQIRHRACSLRDYAFTLVKNEMDSDFEDKCQDIALKRRNRKVSVAQYLPPYIHTHATVDMKEHDSVTTEAVPEVKPETETTNNANNETEQSTTPPVSTENTMPISTSRVSVVRKRKIPSWQRGFLTSKKKKRKAACTETSPDQNDEKATSEDETKENSTEISSADVTANSKNCSSLQVTQETVLNSTTEITTPLYINCDTPLSSKVELPVTPQSSTKHILNELLSPSELLGDSLEFDDIDQALNETAARMALEHPIEINKDELEKTLETAVKITTNYPLQSLLDLYNQLAKVIKQFSRTHNRRILPKDMQRELLRFKNENNFRINLQFKE